ncbi:MAG: L-threonylcarbamoyladenylate synthase [Planctomycetota bacterium]
MRVIRVPQEGFDPEILREPAEILRAGGLVAIPTETVYGLAASAESPAGVERLVRAKGRPEGKPFAYHFATREDALAFLGPIPASARALLDRYCPGPLTLVVDKDAPGGRSAVGVRVPANDIARAIIRLAGAPLLLPSANRSGGPPAVTAEEVAAIFGDEIDAIVDGGETAIRQPSTVVRVDESGYEVLREGIITKEMIHQLLHGRRVLFVCTGNTCRSPMAAELFRKHLAARLGKAPDELDELGYRILSAGTFATWGNRSADQAVAALEAFGCDLSRHVSRPLTLDLLAEVDQVYTLSRSHYELVQKMLESLDPAERPKLSMLQEEGIIDPLGGDLEAYRECAREIEKAILRVLPR